MGARWGKIGSLVFLLGLLVLVAGCEQPSQPGFQLSGDSLEITHLTSGTIDAHTLIAVRYKDAQVTEDLYRKALPVDVFSFSPEIKGKTYWQDSRTLVFEPDQPLYSKAQYQAVLDHAKLLPEGKRAAAASVGFQFETPGQELVALDGAFVPTQQGQLDQVYFTSTLEFGQKVSLEVLSSALQLTLDGQPLEFAVETADGYSFTAKSAELERLSHTERKVTITLEGGPLSLEKDVARQFVLPALMEPLAVERIEEERVGDFSQLRLIFTEPLKEAKDYAGYMSILPTMRYGVAVEGNSLVVTGEFRPGEKYSLRLFPGIESVSGQKLSEQTELFWEVQISDRKPAVEFVNSGMFMTTSSNQKIAFRTMNVERIRLQVKRVPQANLIEFFEENSYYPQSSSFSAYNRYGFQRYGEVLVDSIINIGREMNKWVYSELDLADVLTDNGGLYIVQLSFDENHALYFPEEYDWYDISSYTAARGQAVKHVLVSNIGITAKELLGEMHVFLTDLLTTDLLPGAEVMLKDGSGKVLDRAETNDSGWAVLKTNSHARYIEVNADSGYAILSLSSSQLNNSLFDIGGVQRQDGIDAFIYTERGVYRPGDPIHLGAIVRNDEHTFPENHPITLYLYNPLGRLVHEEVLTRSEDGFYAATVATDPSSPTGTWEVVLDIGGRLFTHPVRVETIVPYRIRVQLEASAAQLGPNDEYVDMAIKSEYLFGAPASGLTHETTAVIEPVDVSFSRYQGFVFGNESINFPRMETAAIRDALDDAGEYTMRVEVPNVDGIPSALRLRIDTKVYESGGRFVPATAFLPIEVYPSYVGIMPDGGSEMGMGDQAGFHIVHVTSSGEPIPNSELEYTIYRYRYYWWWEYDSQADFRRHYKSNGDTVILEQGKVSTNEEGVAYLRHTLADYGEILVEVKDPQGGHSAGYFFRSYWFGGSYEPRTADIVNLKLDRPSYYPGETALVTLNTPAQGRALITLEKEGQILYQSWEELTGTESTFAVPVDERCIPNAYLSVMAYQPFDQKDNDLPLRVYGVVPLYVISEGTKFSFQINAPEAVRPEEEFTVKVQTSDGSPAQFTLAVVDEGILDITGFETPEPWDHFFAKQRLLTKTYDNFSDVIDLYYGYMHNTLSVGGGMEADYREQRVGADDAKRFEPVSIFKGPFKTDESGSAEVTLEVPNYIGSLRVMAVGAHQGRYGSGEQRVAVKSPVMVLPTLPRVVGPEDQFVVPVTVFALEEGVGEVLVTLDVTGPIAVSGPTEFTLDFSKAESQEIRFDLEAQGAIGTAQITVSAHSPAFQYSNISETELAVRPYNPVIYFSDERLANPGESLVLFPPREGVPGTESLQLTVSAFRGLNINHRLKWLIRYPYGCLEQVTSTVFPQLYLPEVFNPTSEELQDIDENINAAIQAFREYQLGSGGFSYWPNQSTADYWSTNYAGHFLLEARAKGYHIPRNMLEMWAQFQQQAARENLGNTLTRAYRLYLLALAGRPELSAMNYMRESELGDLGNPGKYLLAGAYHLLGYGQIRDEILATADLRVPDYFEFGDTFGSTLRDRAVILHVLTLIGDYNKGAALYDVIARAISSNEWYSTQATAYSLMALTKYIAAVKADSPGISGRLVTDSLHQELAISDVVGIVPLPAGEAVVYFENTSEVPLFVTLEWEGIPKRDDLAPVQQGLALRTGYFNAAGEPVDISRLRQGDSFYMVFRVAQEDWEYIDEVALVQILPAGWEIENPRLSTEGLPDWAMEYFLGLEDYVDIRDDRIMWFFDKAPYYSYDFMVKINAVTVGKFYLPPTLLEAMYNNDYKVVTRGRIVEVLPR